MPHDLDAQRMVNLCAGQPRLDTSTPMMVTGDVHIPFKEWAGTHEVLRMASYKTTFSQREVKKEVARMSTPSRIERCSCRRLTSLSDMFARLPPGTARVRRQEAIANTHEFARQVALVRDRQDDEGSEGHR